jgi:hypothetical protein
MSVDRLRNRIAANRDYVAELPLQEVSERWAQVPITALSDAITTFAGVLHTLDAHTTDALPLTELTHEGTKNSQQSFMDATMATGSPYAQAVVHGGEALITYTADQLAMARKMASLVPEMTALLQQLNTKAQAFEEVYTRLNDAGEKAGTWQEAVVTAANNYIASLGNDTPNE